MIILFEILFALWSIHVFTAVCIGLAQIFLGLAAQVAAWLLLLLSTGIEMFCRHWRTAFSDVAS